MGFHLTNLVSIAKIKVKKYKNLSLNIIVFKKRYFFFNILCSVQILDRVPKSGTRKIQKVPYRKFRRSNIFFKISFYFHEELQ